MHDEARGRGQPVARVAPEQTRGDEDRARKDDRLNLKSCREATGEAARVEADGGQAQRFISQMKTEKLFQPRVRTGRETQRVSRE